MLDLGGTIRACSPEATLQKLLPLFDYFGITRVADITGLDTIGVAVYVCIRPNAKLLSTAQGKAISPLLAKISAIMESIEVWHAENIREPSIFGPYSELKKSHNLPSLSSLTESTINYPDSESKIVAWIETTNIIDNTPLLMPYSNYCLDSTKNCFDGGLFTSNSNGLASGNTFEEALCHALYELVERDCTANFFKMHLDQSPSHCIQKNTIQSTYIQYLISAIESGGLSLSIYDMTHHLGIPTFYALLSDSDDVRNLGAFSGYGTHLSKDIALSRAITEAIQSRLTYISGSRDDMLPFLYKRDKGSSIQPILLTPEKNYNDCITHELPTTFDGCVNKILSMLKRNQITQVAFYNHTRSDINIPVVHAIAPELNHDWRQHRMTT